MKLSNEAKVGLLATLAIAILVIGFNYLKGQKIFSSQNTYYATYDKVDGLFEANPVFINGFKVGIVESISLDKETLSQMNISFLIDNGVKIPEGTVASIASAGLLGDKAVNLIFPTDSTKSLAEYQFLEDGDELVGQSEVGMVDFAIQKIDPIVEGGTRLIESLDSTLTSIKLVVNSGQMDEMVGSLNASVKNVQGVLNDVEVITKNLSDFTGKDLLAISSNIQTIGKDIGVGVNRTFESVDKMTANLTASTTKVDALLNSANRAADGAIGVIDKVKDMSGNLYVTTAKFDGITNNLSNVSQKAVGMTDNLSKVSDKVVGMADNLTLVSEKALGMANNLTTASQKAIGMTDNLNKVSEKAVGMVDNLSKVSEKAVGMTDNLATVSQKAIGMTDNLTAVSKKAMGMTDDLAIASKKFVNVADDAKNIMGSFSKTSDNLAVFSDSLKHLKINETVGETNKTLKQTQTTIAATQAAIEKTVAQTTAALDNATKMLAEVNTITKKINDGEGSVGMLMNDKELYTNLTTMTNDLTVTTKKVNTMLTNLPDDPKKLVKFSIFSFGKKDKKKKKKETKAMTAVEQ